MKKLLTTLLIIGLGGGLYLGFWPVPITPVVWEAPPAPDYTGAFAPNTALAGLERLDIGERYGPEDVAVRGGEAFTVSHGGDILAIDLATGAVRVLAELGAITQGGAVPLGLEFDATGQLIVADAYNGLFSISPDGQVKLLTNQVDDGDPILYADDLDILPSGIIYFSDASTKFGAKGSGSTMQGSVLEIIEHGRTGRILKYDPVTMETSVVATGFSFSNGVAAGPNGQSIYVTETGEYRVVRLWVEGPRAGEREIVIDNLPGFPDNINRGPDGTYLFGLIGPRLKVLDDLAAKPFWRKVIIRLPKFLEPAPVHYGHIVQIDAAGNVLRTWQDPDGAYHDTTGAVIAGGYLYVSSLTETTLARKKL